MVPMKYVWYHKIDGISSIKADINTSVGKKGQILHFRSLA
jgi:hypothetical protein